MELKSPSDHKTTVLHYLVAMVDEKSPETIEFIASIADRVTHSATGATVVP